MNFKTLPLFLLSLSMLSGCTNSCKGDQNQSAPAAEQAPVATTSGDSSEVVPTEQDAPNGQASVDDTSGTVAPATEEN